MCTRVKSSCWIVPFIVMKCPSLSIDFVVVCFVWCKYCYPRCLFFPFAFAWNILFPPFTFIFCVCFYLKWVSCRQHHFVPYSCTSTGIFSFLIRSKIRVSWEFCYPPSNVWLSPYLWKEVRHWIYSEKLGYNRKMEKSFFLNLNHRWFIANVCL